VKILSEELTQQIKGIFENQLTHPVELLYFFDKDQCDTCEEFEQLIDELSSLSTRLFARKYDVNKDVATSNEYAVQNTPALVITGTDHGHPMDYGIRFYGTPSGYEFGSLIHTIIMLSKRDSGLKPEVRKQLADWKKPVHLRVFVTPT
jgi:alkyl hydroperoxide reductase subunit AhpF